MTMRFGKIIIHKPEPPSETDSGNGSTDETEVAEIAETATLRYAKKVARRRSERQNNMLKSKNGSGRRSRASVIGANELPILCILNSDKSPPLLQSHYISENEDRLQEKGLSNQVKPTNTKCAEECDRLGFRVLTSRSRTPDNAVQRRAALISDAHANQTYVHSTDDEEDSSLKGFTRLLRNLNISERLRQQKAEQERLNIHKLPDHMREQLKHIYVY